jgi:hypothetical protein
MGKIKIKLREIVFGDVDWIHLVQDRDRLQVLVNTVIKLQVHKTWEISRPAERKTLSRTLLRYVNSLEIFHCHNQTQPNAFLV